MESKTGVIYILTTPSFPEYLKIGYADDIEKRLVQLNRSECVPFAFRVYATYEVNSRLSDMKIHEIIDKLNPNLRSIETFGGKKRVCEFYAMTAEDAYALLEAIAEIHGCTDKLVKVKPTASDEEAEEIADEIAAETTERMEAFSFSKCNIPVGAELHYVNDPAITCVVASDRKVTYKGEELSLSLLAKRLDGKWKAYQGLKYFTYNGEVLADIRHRLGV